MRLALATCAAWPRLSQDDRLLQQALASRGIVAEAAVWDEAAVEWSGYAAVVVRSCWDYHLRGGAFEGWIDRLERTGIPLWNPPAVLRWNMRKTYLRDLETAGVPTIATRFVESAEETLESILDQAGWDEAVVKPVLSASAHETWRVSRATAGSHRSRYRRVLGDGPVMVQPFIAAIPADGEWSLCFFGDAYSHAVIKRPRPGDFRVQSDHGGVSRAADAPGWLIDRAGRALRASGHRTAYARVDGCVIDGEFLLMELELLEPGMFLASDPAAPARFADAVVRAAAQE